MVELIGAPFDQSGSRPGSRLGPDALRLAELEQSLAQLGLDVVDGGNIDFPVRNEPPLALLDFDDGLPYYHAVRDRVAASLRSGRTPLVLGGDHSLSVGSVSGALAHFGDDLAVLWIDAHADLNSPWTSPSGRIHGMVLGALMHRTAAETRETGRWWQILGSDRRNTAEAQWKQLCDEVVGHPKLAYSKTGWFALRDVDPGEQDALAENDPGYVATMYDIDRYGAVPMIEKISAWLERCGATKLWLSFDVDALDPILAPGTGTAVRGGLTYREMHVLGELLYETLFAADRPIQLAGLDLVEINPLFDTNNETAKTAKEWMTSLFGKSILGRHNRSQP